MHPDHTRARVMHHAPSAHPPAPTTRTRHQAPSVPHTHAYTPPSAYTQVSRMSIPSDARVLGFMLVIMVPSDARVLGFMLVMMPVF